MSLNRSYFNKVGMEIYPKYKRWTFAIVLRRAHVSYEDGNAVSLEIYFWRCKTTFYLWKFKDGNGVN